MGTLPATFERRALQSQPRSNMVFFRTPSLSIEQERFLYECVSKVGLDETQGALNLDLQLPKSVDAAFEQLIWQLAARPLDVAVRIHDGEKDQSRVETFPGHCSVASIFGYISGKKNLSTLRLRFDLQGWGTRLIP
ncbi:MAG: hypothetical protein RBU21_01370 [FCB group bacterium]|nr:hypothetical protein [FCB group bacterium]